MRMNAKMFRAEVPGRLDALVNAAHVNADMNVSRRQEYTQSLAENADSIVRALKQYAEGLGQHGIHFVCHSTILINSEKTGQIRVRCRWALDNKLGQIKENK